MIDDKMLKIKIVVVDADFQESERLEKFILEKEKTLNIKEEIYATRIFLHHADAYEYLAAHREYIGIYFVKILTESELLILKKLQALNTQIFFVIYTDDDRLSSDLLSLTASALWTQMTVRSNNDADIKQMIEKALKFVFVNSDNIVKINGFPIAVNSLLYIEGNKNHRNYLHAVTSDNECLIRGTLTEVKNKIPALISFGRGLLVHPAKIRRVEADGLTICFFGYLKKILIPFSYKKELMELKKHSDWIK
ncbi:LytTR family transcriptional regulator DNA-binding domain-containing protein [Lactococcus nasutitermitis]|uniref:LytTR family transcriptional regulator DNA-binding domain-containing protein n=1 Tax=Lactococcus nasutitermitis TaxID=1652957 RepID=A0ABV9JF86_9LACT|nr:LytTR family transcriptional regulator DNA-binding domain-containing protein [Lactococcus nasutitermitis]